jgi:hypothetical protein
MNELLQDALRWTGGLSAIAYLVSAAWLCIAAVRHEAANPTIAKENDR